MANMSYVRFENTLRDLRDVKYALEELLNDPDEPELSRSEWDAMLEMRSVVEDVQELIDEVTKQQDERGGLREGY